MAALQPTERIPWTYTDDTGKVWRVAAEEAVAQQAKQGGAATDISTPSKPGNIKMRRTTVRFGALSRSVVLYDATQVLVNPSAPGTILLNHGGLAADIFQCINTVIPEHRPRSSVMSNPS